MNFEEWKSTGPALINALKIRGEEETFKQLLSDLYPKKAHFIYELFQNAEDAGASECFFSLHDDYLVYEHNGRVFNENDVRSICGIGKSLKRNDPTKIGQFGVGFKAVFAYTNSPEIYSGSYKFRIKDLLIFDDNIPEKTQKTKFSSHFRFPFNNLDKSKIDAFSEIKNVLTNLGDNTLLFLKNIKKISFQIHSETGSLERIELGGNKIKIIKCLNNDQNSTSQWLRYDNEVNIIDEQGLDKLCRISVAFSLENAGKNLSKFKIMPINFGEVSIYFPAEKEVSNLKFHIHAPFASTIARDSIRECASNESLRDEIANLVISSIHALKNDQLLDIDFLSVLPNNEDMLGAFYAPIRKRVIDAFHLEPLLPTLSGEFSSANKLFKGPLQIQNVINDDSLSLFTGYEKPLWLKNPDKSSSRSNNFINSINIDLWSWDELINTFKYPSDETNLQDWVSKLSLNELLSFYLLLGQAVELHGGYLYGIDLKIIKFGDVNDDKFDSPERVFLKSETENGQFPTDIQFCYPEKYFPDISDKNRKLLINFYDSIGVKVFDKKESIKKIVANYDSGEIDISKHIDDLRLFISYLSINQNDEYFFKRKNILLSLEFNNSLKIKCAQDIYLDAPYVKTGLEELSSIHKKSKLWPGYLEYFKDEEYKAFLDFLIKIGIFHRFQVVQQSTSLNPASIYLRQGYGRESANKIDQDFTIPNLKKYLRNPTYVSSKLIWDAIITTGSQCAIAKYRRHAHAEEREADSYLVTLLKEGEWIPSSEGKFLSPKKCSKDLLGTDFPYDDRNGLLTKIDFGKDFLESGKDYESYKRVVESKGVSPEEFDDLLNSYLSSEKSLGELKAFLNKSISHKLPRSPVVNLQRRSELLLDEKDRFFIEKVKLERSLFKGLDPIRASAKVYLRTLYKNIDNEMICQCCRNEMPFKLKVNNEHYFEAIKIIENKIATHPQCRLALCPNCAAKYLHARDTLDDHIVHDILSVEFDQNIDHVEINISLAERNCSLYFVAKHFFDVQVILKSINRS